MDHHSMNRKLPSVMWHAVAFAAVRGCCFIFCCAAIQANWSRSASNASLRQPLTPVNTLSSRTASTALLLA
jgi:hypothetical protein